MTRPNWWRRLVREFVWTVDFCDGTGDPSLAKGTAALFAILTGFDMVTKGVNASNVAMAAITLSAAFGRSAWMHWLDRYSATSALSATASASVDGTAALGKVTDAIVDRLSPHSPHGGE